MSTVVGIVILVATLIGGILWNLSNNNKDQHNTPLTQDGRVNQIDSQNLWAGKEQTLFEDKVPAAAAPQRVQHTQEEIEYLKANPPRLAGDALILMGQVLPPVVDGKTLQASSVHIDHKLTPGSKRVYIGYSMRGEAFLGAVQIIEITRSKQKALESRWEPRVVQTVVFRNFDIHAVTQERGILYLGGGTGDESFKTPAVMEVIKLVDGMIPQNFTSARIDLPSYTVTSIAVTEFKTYVATGDRSGGILELPQNIPTATTPIHYQTLDYRLFELDDVRDLTFDKNFVYAVKGTDAGLWLLDRRDPKANGRLINLHGATIPESKSTIELTRNSILLALGDGGVQILDRKDFSLRHELKQKQHYKNDNSLSVSNAATGHHRQLFIADGEEGLRVMTLDKSKSQFIQTTQIKFGDEKSVNDIKYFNGLLIIASGLGGVKIAHFYRGNPSDILDEASDHQKKPK